MGAWVVAIGVVVSQFSQKMSSVLLRDLFRRARYWLKGVFTQQQRLLIHITFVYIYSLHNTYRRHGTIMIVKRIHPTPSQKKSKNHGINKRKLFRIRRNRTNNHSYIHNHNNLKWS
jgi:hypothetical protein